ncbi:MAG: bifunctional adenosylcobinamide kinase/adenosylcobinamide-phosphate guanylyltransferase [Candidatus Omnitrophica bacterium]|nr:bifunctional adenosylcobinamide kinase/adenosylcobinamide-phosphate guanylyltransferase [Candidatus Omnitrophota bacterium]
MKLPRNQKGRLILITGGTRSGKSRFAVELAKRCGQGIVYLATCKAADREMRQRIAHHRRHRPAHWRTIEHPRDPAKVVAQLNGKSDGLILDCLTMYVSQLLVTGQSDARIEQQVRRLCHVLRRTPYPVILVTNEVGSGIVPEFPMGRRFRDLAGLTNQIAAALADEVYLLVAGIPALIKARSSSRRSAHASLVTA